MSLRVWLPLNGTLDNQGLDDITCTLSGGITVDNSGKIGKCYNFDGTNGQLLLTNLDLRGLPQVSFAFWCCPIEDLGGLFQISVGGTYRFQIGSPNLTFRDSNNSSTRSVSYNTTFVSGQWVHIACIYNRGQIIIYVNGVQTNRNSTYFHEDSVLYSDLNQYRIGRIRVSSGDIHYNGKLNDFRIYDHALSAMEVKQLSQGLILHYPLNRNGWGQENLLPNSKLDGSWEYPSTNYKDQYAPIITSVPNGSVYTLSFDAKSTVNGDKIRTHYYSPNTTTTCTSSQGAVKTASDGNMDFTLSTQWKRYWVVYNQNETSAVKHIICPRMVSGQGIGVVSVKNVKLEEGSIATPWCPNSSDALATTMGLNDNIEHDTSGYGNNLNNFTNTIYTSDTPKYLVSTFLSGSTYGSYNSFYSSDSYQNAMTVACWVKRTFSDATERFITNSWVRLYTYTDFKVRLTWRMSTGSADTTNTWASGQILPLNEWTHVCFTMQDGIVKCYINGTLKNTSDRTQYGTYIHGVMSNGFGGLSASAKQWIGGLSDFRFYATALSADDVKSLYNNSAYIDNQGNIYGAVYEEG